MASPLILIVGRVSDESQGVRGLSYAAGRLYFDAVQRAGGIPIMLPPLPSLIGQLPELLGRVDGIVMHGGGDVDPRRYGQSIEADEVYGIVGDHDEVELAVVHAAQHQDLPMLAICRGIQVLNVAMGGTLLQHIGNEDHWFQFTQTSLLPGSLVAKAMGTDWPMRCHCVHHQAIDTVANGLAVVGTSPDGIIHAVEVTGARWTVGTQWHPEDSAATDPQQQGLFDELVRQA